VGRGFTLVEILIAIFILSIVMATVYVSYSGTLKTARQLEEERDIYSMARVTMDRMIQDLSSLQTSEGSFYLLAEKKKTENRTFHYLSFWSAAHLAFGENEMDGRPATITYYVTENEKKDGFSLFRRDLSGDRPDTEEKMTDGFVICKNVNNFQLTFYDKAGMETDAWRCVPSGTEKKDTLPVMVKIELSLINPHDPEKPYKFMTKVFLPAAVKL
jgi:general secretion pathway protein J